MTTEGHEKGFGEFWHAYQECAVWASSDPDTERPLDETFSVEDLDGTDWWSEHEDECVEFWWGHRDLLLQLPDDYGPARAGHDFWLTRNRSGVGFWDRGLGELGKKLTEQAHAFGEANLFPWDITVAEENRAMKAGEL